MYLKEPYRTTDRSAACKAKNAYPLGFRVISGQRYLHTELGRWTRRDPIEERGGFNLFVFVTNDPLDSVDPKGEISWRDVRRFFGTIGGGLGLARCGCLVALHGFNLTCAGVTDNDDDWAYCFCDLLGFYRNTRRLELLCRWPFFGIDVADRIYDYIDCDTILGEE